MVTRVSRRITWWCLVPVVPLVSNMAASQRSGGSLRNRRWSLVVLAPIGIDPGAGRDETGLGQSRGAQVNHARRAFGPRVGAGRTPDGRRYATPLMTTAPAVSDTVSCAVRVVPSASATEQGITSPGRATCTGAGPQSTVAGSDVFAPTNCSSAGLGEYGLRGGEGDRARRRSDLAVDHEERAGELHRAAERGAGAPGDPLRARDVAEREVGVGRVDEPLHGTARGGRGQLGRRAGRRDRGRERDDHQGAQRARTDGGADGGRTAVTHGRRLDQPARPTIATL